MEKAVKDKGPPEPSETGLLTAPLKSFNVLSKSFSLKK